MKIDFTEDELTLIEAFISANYGSETEKEEELIESICKKIKKAYLGAIEKHGRGKKNGRGHCKKENRFAEGKRG